jgi:hypothetical protein
MPSDGVLAYVAGMVSQAIFTEIFVASVTAMVLMTYFTTSVAFMT